MVAPQHAEQPAHLGERATPDVLDGLQDLARPVALGAQHASLRAGLHHDHRHVVGDHVVQLACDAGALLDDGLPRGQIAFALGDLRALLAITDDAVDEQQDDDGHDVEREGLLERDDAERRKRVRDRDQDNAHGEQPRLRPDRQRVQAAHPGDAVADGRRRTPDRRHCDRKESGCDADRCRVRTPDGDEAGRHPRHDQRHDAVVGRAAGKQDLDRRKQHEERRNGPIERQRIRAPADDASEARNGTRSI